MNRLAIVIIIMRGGVALYDCEVL